MASVQRALAGDPPPEGSVHGGEVGMSVLVFVGQELLEVVVPFGV